MKNILYYIYAAIFYMYNIFPVKSKKTTFIMTHDSSINGNIMRMYKEVIKNQPDHICKFITKGCKNKKKIIKIGYYIKFIFITPYYLATSKTIFLDNVFLPMAYMRFRKEVNIVQLWHGCNTLKKFGQLSNEGKLKILEKKANSRYTHVIVSSKEMIKLHKEAFDVKEEVIYPLGLPRLDLFFDESKIIEEKKKFYLEFPQLKGKKIILYAPTFRDDKLDKFDKNMNLNSIINKMPNDYILINKFHPFVSKKYGKIEGNRMLDMSEYEDLTRLMLVSDRLISDYSSIVFDYAILNKPIIFYAYDKDEYENNIRGFYQDYIRYAGNYVKSKNEIINVLTGREQNISTIKMKNIEWIQYKDKNSSKRIYNYIYCGE